LDLLLEMWCAVGISAADGTSAADFEHKVDLNKKPQTQEDRTAEGTGPLMTT
jgi:hypothetical protein